MLLVSCNLELVLQENQLIQVIVKELRDVLWIKNLVLMEIELHVRLQ